MDAQDPRYAPFYRIHIRKEAQKFSCSHMTVFADGTKEALHGHNYIPEISLKLKRASLQSMLPFVEVKKAMKAVSAAWDEKLLLPDRCPFFKVMDESDREIEFTLCGKRYVIPREETIRLPVDNVTAESLAEQYFAQWRERASPDLLSENVLEVEVRIDEICGQGASYVWRNPKCH